MIIDQLNKSPRSQLNRILRVLKENHNTTITPGVSAWNNLVQSAQRDKQQITESSKFNTYMTQPAYVKASLILEAHALWQQIRSTQRASHMMEDKKPDFLDFDKDGNRKESMKQALKDKEEANMEEAKQDPEADRLRDEWLAKNLPQQGRTKKAKGARPYLPGSYHRTKTGSALADLPVRVSSIKQPALQEKWDVDMKTAPKDVGKWEGYTIAELKARKNKLMDKAERSAAEQKEVRQLNFAIRAKQTDKFGKIKETRTLHEDANLDKAETLLAAKSISDRLQKMAEDAAKMAVDDLMPLVDTMKDQFGLEAATAFNNVVKQQLQTVLDGIVAAKDQTDNAINTMETGGMPAAPSDIAQPLPPMSGTPSAEPAPAPEAEPAPAEPGAPAAPEGDIDFEKAFDAMPTTSGPEEAPLGREMKESVREADQSAVQSLKDMATKRKDDKGKPLTPVQVKAAQEAADKMEKAKLSEAKKAMQPGAVATAQVKKMGTKYWTGEHLTKMGIRKRDEIIRSIEKDLKESEIKNLTAQVKTLKTEFDQLHEQYQAHRSTQTQDWLAEQADLAGVMILENMKHIKREIEQVLEHRRDLKQALAEQAAFVTHTAHQIVMLEQQLTELPYGVRVTRTNGKSQRKFFENADLRNTWISYNQPQLASCELIEPQQVKAVMDRLRSLI